MLISILVFVLILLFFQKQVWSKSMSEYRHLLSLAFGLKVMVGLAYLWVYTYYYGDGKLMMDAGITMEQSVMLKNVLFQSPTDYFKLFTGIGENQALIERYLSETVQWNSDQMTLFSDSKNMIRFNSILAIFSGGNPIFHSLILNFLSLLGVFQLVKVIEKYVQVRFEILFWSFLLLPNFLFWSSGILKEPLAIFGIGFLLNSFFLPQKNNTRKWIKMGIGIFFSLSFKPYIIGSLGLIFAFYVVAKNGKRIPNVVLFLSVFFFLFLGIFILRKTELNPLVLLTNKQLDFDNIGKGGIYFTENQTLYHASNEQRNRIKMHGDSLYVLESIQVSRFQKTPKYKRTFSQLPASKKAFTFILDLAGSNSYYALYPINESFLNLLYLSPQGVVNSVFRPFPWDEGGVFKYMSVLETVLLVTFLVYAIMNRRVLNVKEKRILWSIALFVFLLALFFGWIVCISGAIVRYRIPIYLMILFAAFLILNPTEKWKKKIE